ncbi:MAG: GDP-mannose dehydrogenase [Anaerolineae bacterium]|nr:nucleotide sugar dehydrogenase [Anaerolineales bacterium]MCQ3975031.1 GDP-mannose dehydrogenase [Anaerolineae bacterium]
MRIAIFGLGYVGCVSAACFAREGHEVIGVDVNPLKVNMINAGQSPIIETGVDELIHQAVTAGRLRATTLTAEAITQADVSLICVGTPSNENGSLDLKYVHHVAGEIGQALTTQKKYHVIAIRSTVLPGTVTNEVIPLLEEISGLKVGTDFGVCSNPEFLREGSAVADFYRPAFTLIGQWDERSGDRVAAIYKNIDAPVVRTDLPTAEMIKYVSNTFHALKITFANEIGNFCKKMSIDSHEVMRIFCMDTKLNISPVYLKPGYAFGGSCLPKDLRALLHRARQEDLDLPVLQAIPRSNELQARLGVEAVLRTGKKRIGILGLSFKAGTDDLRESPLVYLAETLLGKGYDLRIYDENVSMARLTGANKQYIEKVIPHISSLLSSSLDEVLAMSEVLVVGNRLPAVATLLEQTNDRHIIIDLVRIREGLNGLDENYQGICW